MPYHSRHEGTFLARVRKTLFGLSEKERLDNHRFLDSLTLELRRKNAREDRLFDEWWERFPEQRHDLDKFDEFLKEKDLTRQADSA